MSNARREQSEGVEFFTFDRFGRLTAGLGDVPDEHHVSQLLDFSIQWLGDGGEVEVEEAIVGVEDFEVAVDRLATRTDEAFPIESPNEAVELAAHRSFRIEAKESAGRAVEKGNGAVRVEEEDSFLKRFEDLFQKPFLAQQAIHEGLDLPRFEPVQTGEEFLDKARMHDKFVVGLKSVLNWPVKAQERIFVVLCTFPDRDQARQIGTVLVERQLAACVNLIPKIESIYRWEGRICREEEVLGLIKVAEAGFEALKDAILELHPYETPEVIALPVEAGNEAYLSWVAAGI